MKVLVLLTRCGPHPNYLTHHTQRCSKHEPLPSLQISSCSTFILAPASVYTSTLISTVWRRAQHFSECGGLQETYQGPRVPAVRQILLGWGEGLLLATPWRSFATGGRVYIGLKPVGHCNQQVPATPASPQEGLPLPGTQAQSLNKEALQASFQIWPSRARWRGDTTSSNCS